MVYDASSVSDVQDRGRHKCLADGIRNRSDHHCAAVSSAWQDISASATFRLHESLKIRLRIRCAWTNGRPRVRRSLAPRRWGDGLPIEDRSPSVYTSRFRSRTLLWKYCKSRPCRSFRRRQMTRGSDVERAALSVTPSRPPNATARTTAETIRQKY